jgi:uncharacterized delta-60 repeat protein
LGFGGGNAWAAAEAAQSDGKLVLAGGGASAPERLVFEVVRFGTNNTLDGSFGLGGKVLTAVGSGPASEAYAVAVQTDGKIVAAGFCTDVETNLYFALARYDTNGTLDSTFGNGGTVVTDLGGDSVINAVAIQPDGKIVVAGTWEFFSFAVSRYLTNGMPDSSFASGGTAITEMEREQLVGPRLGDEQHGKRAGGFGQHVIRGR